MEVRESPCLAPKEVADLADRFAFAGKTATHNPIGIELLWRHVKVTEANALVRRIDNQIEAFLPGCAQHRSIAHGDEVMHAWLAVRSRTPLLAESRPQILALVAQPPGALADVKVAALTEIVAPWV